MNFSTIGRAELRWEETVGNSLGGAWLEGASMQRGRTGNRANSFGGDLLGASEHAAWTDRKLWK